MHIVFIIIHRYFIGCIDIMNRCGILLLLYIEYIISIFITCMIHYFCWILMTWYFFTCIVLISYFIIDTSNSLSMSFFLKTIEFFYELLVLILIWVRFEFPITSSLFDAFELFASLLSKCELTVIHLLFF